MACQNEFVDSSWLCMGARFIYFFTKKDACKELLDLLIFFDAVCSSLFHWRFHVSVCPTLPLIIKSLYWRRLHTLTRRRKSSAGREFIGIAAAPNQSCSDAALDFIYQREIYCLLCMQLHRSFPMLLAADPPRDPFCFLNLLWLYLIESFNRGSLCSILKK